MELYKKTAHFFFSNAPPRPGFPPAPSGVTFAVRITAAVCEELDLLVRKEGVRLPHLLGRSSTFERIHCRLLTDASVFDCDPPECDVIFNAPVIIEFVF